MPNSGSKELGMILEAIGTLKNGQSKTVEVLEKINENMKDHERRITIIENVKKGGVVSFVVDKGLVAAIGAALMAAFSKGAH